MQKPVSSQALTFRGEIIEIDERGEKKMMKINLAPNTIDLPMSMPGEPHLGDLVTVDSLITITNVEQSVFID